MNKAYISALIFCIITSIFQQDIYAQVNEENPGNDFNALFSLENEASLSAPLDAIDRLNDAANPYASQSLPVPIDIELLQYLQEQINSEDSLIEGGSPQDLDMDRFGSFALDNASSPIVEGTPVEAVQAAADSTPRLPQSETLTTVNDPTIGSNRGLNLTPTTGPEPAADVVIPSPSVLPLLLTHAFLLKRRRP